MIWFCMSKFQTTGNNSLVGSIISEQPLPQPTHWWLRLWLKNDLRTSITWSLWSGSFSFCLFTCLIYILSNKEKKNTNLKRLKRKLVFNRLPLRCSVKLAVFKCVTDEWRQGVALIDSFKAKNISAHKYIPADRLKQICSFPFVSDRWNITIHSNRFVHINFRDLCACMSCHKCVQLIVSKCHYLCLRGCEWAASYFSDESV